VSKTYRPYEPRQGFLLPPSPLDWLPDDHLARFVLDVVDELDLSTISGYYEREVRGNPPHHPKMMVALLLYGYSVGVPSSRKIEKRCHEDIAEFRRIHLSALAALYLQVLRLCQELGLVKLGHVALDGTKQKASASKHKAMSYERMQQREDELQAKVEELLRPRTPWRRAAGRAGACRGPPAAHPRAEAEAGSRGQGASQTEAGGRFRRRPAADRIDAAAGSPDSRQFKWYARSQSPAELHRRRQPDLEDR
jgi:transposase